MLSAITTRISAATIDIVRSPRMMNPRSETTTRVTGVASRTSSPSQMNPAGWRWVMSSMISPGSSGGPPASGSMPLGEHQDAADREQQDGGIRPDREESADRPVEVGPGTAVRARGHEKARSSIWKAV